MDQPHPHCVMKKSSKADSSEPPCTLSVTSRAGAAPAQSPALIKALRCQTGHTQVLFLPLQFLPHPQVTHSQPPQARALSQHLTTDLHLTMTKATHTSVCISRHPMTEGNKHLCSLHPHSDSSLQALTPNTPSPTPAPTATHPKTTMQQHRAKPAPLSMSSGAVLCWAWARAALQPCAVM